MAAECPPHREIFSAARGPASGKQAFGMATRINHCRSYNEGMSLSPAEAGAQYLKGLSACQIAAAHPRLTRAGVEARIRAAGWGGVHWCPIHRTYEELTINGPVYAPSLWQVIAPSRWEQPALI
jgi:hypothetical protein